MIPGSLRLGLSAWLLFGAGQLLAGLALGQAPTSDEPAPKSLRELIDSSVVWYQVFPNAEAEKPADVLTVLRWANNARGSEDGMTLLFVHGGRPLAAACVYPWEKRLEHEFESLSRGQPVARRDGQIVWQPQEAGVRFADIPNAATPEETRPQRLRQLKTLAERFQATMLGWKADRTDREELRLLSRPLYRYEPAEGPVTDGAVFAFVMGTDPEALLLIEAVRVGDASKWQFAFARRTSGELEGRLDDRNVWHAPRFPVSRDPRRPHFTLPTPLPVELTNAAPEPKSGSSP